MIGITIGGTNQDAKRCLRESSCGFDATFMIFTLKGEARHAQRANTQNANAYRHECRFLERAIVPTWHFHCRERNFPQIAAFGSLSAKPSISFICFLDGSQASQPDLGCRTPGARAGSRNMPDYLLAVWTTARLLRLQPAPRALGWRWWREWLRII